MFKNKTIKLFLMLGVIFFSIVIVVGCSNVESEKINVKILYRDDIYNIEINKGSQFDLYKMNFILNKEDAIVLYGDNFEKKYNNESLSKDVIFMVCDYNGTENLGKIYTLEDAYDNNYINDDDINKIYNNYTNSNKNLMLEKKIELKILNDRLVELKERNNDASLDDISIYGYYGNYNNSYVIRLSDRYNDFTTVEKELKINDVIFQYSGPSFLVWVDENETTNEIKSFYTLQEAYIECLLNIEDLKKIAAYHNNGQQAKDKLDVEIINQIKEIAAYKWQNDELTPVINAKAEDFVITKYYGTYNNAIVFMINNPYFESPAEDLNIIETVAGIDFYYSSTDRIFVLENINCN